MDERSVEVVQGRLAQLLPRGTGARRAFAAVFVCSIVLRIAALLLVRNAPFVSDARDYTEVAGRLANGEHFVPYWPPGLPLYLELFLRAGASLAVLRASMLPFWLITAWGIRRLADSLGLGQFAWLILLPFSVMPSAIHMSIEPLTQQPVAAFLLLGLAATIRLGRGGSGKESVLLGVSLGCLALTRPSTLPLVLLLPLAAIWGSGKEGRRGMVLAGPAAAFLLALALIWTWVARTHRETGAWILNTSNAVNLYFGNNPWTPLYRTWYFGSQAKPGSPEIHLFPEYEQTVAAANSLPPLEASAHYKQLALDSIKAQPGLFAVRTLNRIQSFFGFDTFTSANLRSRGGMWRRLFPLSIALEALLYLLIAAPAFFWIAARRGLWRKWQAVLLGAAIVAYAAPYWISMSHPTYHYAITAPLALLGTVAWSRGSKEQVIAWRGWAAVALLMVVQVVWVWQMSSSLKK